MNREAKHVLQLVVKPVLTLIGKGGQAANLLITYTGESETHYDALRQVLPSGNYGPAYGWWGMQENAYNQGIKWLNRSENAILKKSILASCFLDMIPPFETLIWNIRFAACMARVQYLQEAEPMPLANDLEGMGRYYVKYYNRGGAANLAKFLTDNKDLVNLNDAVE